MRRKSVFDNWEEERDGMGLGSAYTGRQGSYVDGAGDLCMLAGRLVDPPAADDRRMAMIDRTAMGVDLMLVAGGPRMLVHRLLIGGQHASPHAVPTVALKIRG